MRGDSLPRPCAAHPMSVLSRRICNADCVFCGYTAMCFAAVGGIRSLPDAGGWLVCGRASEKLLAKVIVKKQHLRKSDQ
jgi:hypothetical protein